jgi:hypothetical protein
MSGEGGFFVFDGTVKSLPCLVEDFVFTTTSNNLGINFNATETIYAEHNTLYGEVNWFYPKSGSTQIDRCVTYNYGENVWTTSSLARTTYVDTGVFDVPYATEYDSTSLPVFPDILGITNTYGATTYYAHEVGTDQVNSSGTTAIPAFIQSGDFDITQVRTRQGQATGAVDYRGDGEFFMSVKRFIPDFKVLTGNSKITLLLNDYPNNTASSSPLGPFTITSSTDKIDTRARGRLVALKIENDSTGDLEIWNFKTRCSTRWKKIMAKIVVSIPEPKQEYDVSNQRQILEALDTLKNQLNFSFQQDIRNEEDQKEWFLSG